MASEKIEKKDRTELLGGREVVIPGDGVSPHYWKDTGEAVSADERKLLTALGGGASLNFKGEARQNPEIVFYGYEMLPPGKEGERSELNPIRGVVLDIFQRPNTFKAADDADNEGGGDDDRTRVAAWFLLTAPCWVKTLNKKVRRAQIGEKVWVDLNQATMDLLRLAAPKRDSEGRLTAVCEAAIDPKTKEPFQATVAGKTETHFAWRASIYGGWRSDAGFRKYNSAKEIEATFGGLVTTPASFISDDEIKHALGIALPAHAAAPALTP